MHPQTCMRHHAARQGPMSRSSWHSVLPLSRKLDVTVDGFIDVRVATSALMPDVTFAKSSDSEGRKHSVRSVEVLAY